MKIHTVHSEYMSSALYVITLIYLPQLLYNLIMNIVIYTYGKRIYLQLEHDKGIPQLLKGILIR